MIIIATVPLIVLLLGLVMYLVPTQNTKINEIGRILFFCGVLVSVYIAAGHVVRL